jgi:hypothetical protein
MRSKSHPEQIHPNATDAPWEAGLKFAGRLSSLRWPTGARTDVGQEGSGPLKKTTTGHCEAAVVCGVIDPIALKVSAP